MRLYSPERHRRAKKLKALRRALRQPLLPVALDILRDELARTRSKPATPK